MPYEGNNNCCINSNNSGKTYVKNINYKIYKK